MKPEYRAIQIALINAFLAHLGLRPVTTASQYRKLSAAIAKVRRQRGKA